MTADQAWIPRTRAELGLPSLDGAKEELEGSSVTDEVKAELWEALGDSPIGASLQVMGILVCAFSSVLFHSFGVAFIFSGIFLLAFDSEVNSLHQLAGWPMYVTMNSMGQRHYPKGTNRKSSAHL